MYNLGTHLPGSVGGNMTIETVSVREVRARLRDVLDKILSGETDFVIERNGSPSLP
jgi:hypothetical protein